MTCEELRDHYELFVLGSADEAEAEEIRVHLNRKCEACLAGLKNARALTAMVATTAPSASPRAELRRRIMASVGASVEASAGAAEGAPVLAVKGFRWAPVWAAVAGLAALTAVFFGVRSVQEIDVAAQLRMQLDARSSDAAQANVRVAQLTTQLKQLNDALTIVNSVDAVDVSFGPQQTQPAGRVFVSPRQGVLFIASRLPVAPAGKTYEMWIVPKRGSPAPAGLFQANADGTALHLQPGPVDLDAAGAVAVTLENAGGSATPTAPILIAAALPMRR